MANEEKKPWYKRGWVLLSIAATGIGLVGGGIWLFRRNSNGNEGGKFGKSDEGDSNAFDSASRSVPELPAPTYSAPPSSGYSSGSGSTNFPIQKGSRGEQVKNLQNALMQKFGASILPKWGADGIWGSELTTALTSKGLKTVIDNTTFTDYVTGNFGGAKTSLPPKTTASSGLVTSVIKSVIPSWVTNPYIIIGWQIFDTAKASDINSTVALLQKVNNTVDYGFASEGFQLRPYSGIRRYTLVTGLLDAFKNSPANKAKLREQFRRMGLKETVKNSDPNNYDSSWALSGLGAVTKNIRTITKTIITDGFNISVEIPSFTLLGRWLSSGNGYTRFRTLDDRTMYVRTSAIVFDK